MSKFKVGQTWRNGAGTHMKVTAIEPSNSYVTVEQCDGETDEEGFILGAHLTENGTHNYYSYESLIELSSSVYIAGPMTGYADLNFPAFNAAAKLYRDKGCFVINPAELNGGDAELALYATMSEEEKAEHYTACMRKDIAAITTVDTLVVLPGYSMSRGATMEIQIAQFLGLTIVWPE